MIALALACAAAADPVAPPPDPCAKPEALSAGFVVWVDKSDRRMTVWDGGVLASSPLGPACFPIGLGQAPEGDKARRGDERTPIGDRRVTHRNPKSRYHLSLGLDYPNTADADRALADGRIDRPTRDRIAAADRPGQPARNDTPLGGDIFVHGGGAGADWTDGCVAVDDPVIDWLFEVAGPGTRVTIVE